MRTVGRRPQGRSEGINAPRAPRAWCAWGALLVLVAVLPLPGAAAAAAGSASVAAAGATSVSMVEMGEDHGCAATAAGSVWCWGDGARGQLGNGGRGSSSTATPVITAGTPLAGSGISALEVGRWTTCALSSAGKVACWGRGDSGELGNGATTDALVPTPIDVSGVLAGKTVVDLSLKANHACALTADDVVACWGSGALGQLGNGGQSNSSVPVAVQVGGSALAGKDIVSVEAGGVFSCALASDSTVACWGSDLLGEIGQGLNDGQTLYTTPMRVMTEGTPLEGTVISELDAAGWTACARTSDALVACWGAATELGAGSGSTNAFVPRSVDTSGALAGKTVVEVDAGVQSFCVRTAAGTLACWGRTNYLAFGPLSTSTGEPAPVEVPTAGTPLAPGPAAIRAGFDGTCGIAVSGAVACWGHNHRGQLGAGHQGRSLVPASRLKGALEGRTVEHLAVGRGWGCATTVDDRLACWGDFPYRAGSVTRPPTSIPIELPTAGTALEGRHVEDLVAGSIGGNPAVCAPLDDGSGACWSDTSYTVPTGAAKLWGIPMVGPLAGRQIAQLDGGSHWCTVTTDGLIACWGTNSSGQLGDGTTTNRSDPTSPTIAGTALAGKVLRQVAISGSTTCVLATDSSIACWGSNSNGQLGNGTTTSSSTAKAVTVAGTPLAGASIRSLFRVSGGFCAITTTSVVACWGGVSSLVGSSPLVPTALPVAGSPLAGEDVVALVSVGSSACAVTAEGEVACKGAGLDGALGSGSTVDAPQFGPIATAGTPLSGLAVSAIDGSTGSIAWGGATYCALATGGLVSCWGSDVSGQLGIGGASMEAVPQQVLGLGAPSTAVAPTAPQPLTIVPGPSSLTVTWSPPTRTGGSPVTGYLVRASTAGTEPIVVSSSGSGTSKTVTGLTNGTSYVVSVAAVNAIGTSPWGAGWSETPAGDPVVPGAPTGVSAVAGNGQATVSWTSPEFDGGSVLTGYKVTPFVGASPKPTVTFTSTATSQIISGLTNGSAYTFKVAAVNGVGTGALSSASNPVTPSAGIPYAPFASWSAFVTRQYTDLTTKPPASAELNSWVAGLTAATKTKGDLDDALRRGSENLANVDPVVRIYRAFLGRAPDASGLMFWIGRKRKVAPARTWSVTQIATEFTKSSEFVKKYGGLTNRQWVTQIYTDVLGRTADTAGVDFWTRQLDTGKKTKAQVMVGFSESNEYKTKQKENTDVSVAYIFLLGRAPTTAEAGAWTAAQKAGTSHASLLTDLLGSPGYSAHITG